MEFESKSLFLSLDSEYLADMIAGARRSVCYAAPGILPEPANALAALANRIGPELITVCLDFNERVLRMGFGTLDAVKTIRNSGIKVRSAAGLRTGLVIIDDTGFIFTPTALYLEAEQRANAAPNAMRLMKQQTTEALARLSPASKAIAIAAAETEVEREQIREQAVEVPTIQVADTALAEVEQRLDEAPPVNFDVARQVRVFTPYLQYVELSLTGVAIQRQKLAIPESVQKLGVNPEIRGRLKTTFDLIEKQGRLSSKPLDDLLNEIRKNFTPSLGKGHGRVILKTARTKFEERLEQFKHELKHHQQRVQAELQAHLYQSRQLIVDYYVPLVINNPPDAIRGQFLKFGPQEAERWLNRELNAVFPEAHALIRKMSLDVRYKDVTYETLNQEGFLAAVKGAFPLIDWDMAYDEYRAAGEHKSLFRA